MPTTKQTETLVIVPAMLLFLAGCVLPVVSVKNSFLGNSVDLPGVVIVLLGWLPISPWFFCWISFYFALEAVGNLRDRRFRPAVRFALVGVVLTVFTSLEVGRFKHLPPSGFICWIWCYFVLVLGSAYCGFVDSSLRPRATVESISETPVNSAASPSNHP